MPDKNRRKILRSIGITTIAASGLTGVGTAAGAGNDGQDNGLFEIEEISHSERSQYIGEAWSSEEVKEIRKFLRKEKDVRYTPSDFDGYGVYRTNSGKSGEYDFILLKTPVENHHDLTVRIGDGGVDATATVGDNVYWSHPLTIENGDDFESRKKEPEGYRITTAQILQDELVERGMELPSNCSGTSATITLGTDSIPNWLCELVFVVGGITLTVLPEPTTTAAGVGTLTITAAGGGCVVTHTIEDETAVDPNVDVVICQEMQCGWTGFVYTCWPTFSAWLA